MAAEMHKEETLKIGLSRNNTQLIIGLYLDFYFWSCQSFQIKLESDFWRSKAGLLLSRTIKEWYPTVSSVHPSPLPLFLLVFCCFLVINSCLTLLDLMDCCLPGISQARLLEWVAISFSRGSSLSEVQTCIFCIGRQILYH